MIAGLTMMSDEMAIMLTCMICLATGMMLGMLYVLLKNDKEKEEQHEN